jgi:hypothetical protein
VLELIFSLLTMREKWLRARATTWQMHDDAGPSSMATTRSTQFAVTWALDGKKVCGKLLLFMYAAD